MALLPTRYNPHCKCAQPAWLADDDALNQHIVAVPGSFTPFTAMVIDAIMFGSPKHK